MNKKDSSIKKPAEKIINALESKRILVLGLAETGLSFANYCISKNTSLIFMDDSTNPKKLDEIKSLYPSSNYYLGGMECNESFSLVLVSPGIKPSHKLIQYALKEEIPVLTDLDIFCIKNDSKKIIITGTNGKTTVTTLVNKILNTSGIKSIMGGNISPPILDLINENHDVFVIEASSFQLHHSSYLNADVSVILNITEDHLDWHSSFKKYKKAKLKLSNFSNKIVINSDDNEINIADNSLLNVFRYGIENKIMEKFYLDKNESLSIYYKKKHYLRFNNPYLDFYHNKSNLLAILNVCHIFNVEKIILKKEFEKFKGLPHRMEIIPTSDDFEWINDSKSTNSSSLYAAIKSHKKNIILIMGGDDKGSSFEHLKTNIQNSKVKEIILLGKSKNKIQSILNNKIKCNIVDNLNQAVKIASKVAKNNEVILFSPGCSSKDMFNDYKDRGNSFKKSIKDLYKQ